MLELTKILRQADGDLKILVFVVASVCIFYVKIWTPFMLPPSLLFVAK
jgi:hypothetical protein